MTVAVWTEGRIMVGCMTAAAGLPAADSTGRAFRLMTTFVGTLAAVAAVVLVEDDGAVLCPFRVLSRGAYCPGCGATRAAGHLLRGDIAQSWVEHPFALLAGLQTLVIGVYVVASLLRGAVPRIPWIAILVTNTTALTLIWTIRAAIGIIPTLW